MSKLEIEEVHPTAEKPHIVRVASHLASLRAILHPFLKHQFPLSHSLPACQLQVNRIIVPKKMVSYWLGREYNVTSAIISRYKKHAQRQKVKKNRKKPIVPVKRRHKFRFSTNAKEKRTATVILIVFERRIIVADRYSLKSQKTSTNTLISLKRRYYGR